MRLLSPCPARATCPRGTAGLVRFTLRRIKEFQVRLAPAYAPHFGTPISFGLEESGFCALPLQPSSNQGNSASPSQVHHERSRKKCKTTVLPDF
jgi:hypothetical protein